MVNERYTQVYQKWIDGVNGEYEEQYVKRKELFAALSANDLGRLGYIAWNYVIDCVEPGLWSRILVDLKTRYNDPSEKLTFSVGSCVSVYFLSKLSRDTGSMKSIDSSDAVCSGVVYSLTPDGFKIAVETGDYDIEDLQQYEGSKVSAVLDDSKKVLDKKKDILRHMEYWPNNLSNKFQPVKEMFDCQFDDVDFSKYKVDRSAVQQFGSLSPAQCRIISDVLNTKSPIYCIHGPPGTGKTTTISAIAKEFVKKGMKVLCCAPSNVAVDNMISGCLSAGISPKSMIRLGHPARVNIDLGNLTLDHKVSNNRDFKKAKREETKLRAKINKMTDKEKRASRKLLKDIMMESRNDKGVVYDLIRTAELVFCTPIGASQQSHISFIAKSGDYAYDAVLVDEAAQAYEFETWNVIRFARRAILAGDPMQLPPIGIGGKTPMSLMEVLFKKKDYKKYSSGLLDVQYRMHPNILRWSNSHFYENQLKSADICLDRSLDVSSIADVDPTLSNAISKTFMAIDTSGEEGFQESTQMDNNNSDLSKYITSRCNALEAEYLVRFVTDVLVNTMHVSPSTIIIITPYRSQRQLITDLARKHESLRDVDIGTIDGFQGQEADVVLISLVRSNDEQEIGFLADYRRMNVAITRAKKLCVLIGDTSTVIYGKDKVLGKIGDVLADIENDPVHVGHDISKFAE